MEQQITIKFKTPTMSHRIKLTKCGDRWVGRGWMFEERSEGWWEVGLGEYVEVKVVK